MNTQNFVSGGIGQEFHHAGGVTQGAGSAIGQEREGAGFVCHAVRFQLLLCATHPSNFGAGVNHPRHRVEIHMAVLTGNALSHGNAFFFGFVRQHGATHHVAHGPNARQVGFAFSVHHDGAAFI